MARLAYFIQRGQLHPDLIPYLQASQVFGASPPPPEDDYPPMPVNVWSERHYFGLCKTCEIQGRTIHVCDWVSCPTGGWWSHRTHPDDDHDAEIGWQPEEQMDDHGDLFTVGVYRDGSTG
jgi:hypothetical protein